MNQNYRNENGISVLELKEIIKSWSEYNTDVDSVMFGDNCEVWIETESGNTSQLKSISVLNKRTDIDGNHIFSDILLSTL